jgi:translation initiation factor 2 gamma subunit (eIF-2gamma)
MRSGSEVVPVSALRKFNVSSLLKRIESSLMQMDSASRSLTDTFKLA